MDILVIDIPTNITSTIMNKEFLIWYYLDLNLQKSILGVLNCVLVLLVIAV